MEYSGLGDVGKNLLTGIKYLSLAAASGSNQRSGRNSCASGPQRLLDRCVTAGLTVSVTPSGKC